MLGKGEVGKVRNRKRKDIQRRKERFGSLVRQRKERKRVERKRKSERMRREWRG